MSAAAGMTWPEVRAYLGALAEHASEWAGIPICSDNESMVIHPKYPYAHIFNEKHSEDMEGCTILNIVRSHKLQKEMYVWLEADGSKHHGILPLKSKSEMHLRTMGQYPMWNLDAEIRAMGKLGTMTTPAQRHCYLLTGSFLETSKRSGVIYCFRRLRPTLAYSGTASGGVRLLCALCLHPIGYVTDSWAGAMVPTDEVVAHLTLMRGNEHGFWKQANQIPGDREEAGL